MPYASTPENMEIVAMVCDSLRKLKVNEVLTKKQLDNVLQGKPHLLAKARRLVEQEQGVIFATVIGVGIKKLDTKMAHTVGVKAREKSTRTLKKAQGQIIAVIRETQGVADAHTRLQLTNEVNKLGLAAEFCKD